MKHLLPELIFSIVAFPFLTNAAFAADYEIKLTDFTDLKVVNNINVNYYATTDSIATAVFTCDPSLAPLITFKDEKKRLTIEVMAEDGKVVTGLPTVNVYSSILESLENSGDSLVQVFTPSPVQNLKVKLIGNGDIILKDIHTNTLNASTVAGNGTIKVSGKTRVANFKTVGAGGIDATDLNAVQVKCSVYSSSPIECTATEKLHINGLGSGKVIYHGAPAEISNKSIGVKIAHADAPNDTINAQK